MVFTDEDDAVSEENGVANSVRFQRLRQLACLAPGESQRRAAIVEAAPVAVAVGTGGVGAGCDNGDVIYARAEERILAIGGSVRSPARCWCHQRYY